jgi:Fe2+ transport system protein FeoA
MVTRYLTCPLCGFEFERTDTLCAHGCPLGSMCHLIRCPSCEYEFPEAPRSVSWIKTLFRERPEPATGLPEGVRTVNDLQPGECARVVCLGPRHPARQGTLSVFGLVPGAAVTLVQRKPSCVVRIGETELALDSDIAAEILVGSVSEDAPTGTVE